MGQRVPPAGSPGLGWTPGEFLARSHIRPTSHAFQRAANPRETCRWIKIESESRHLSSENAESNERKLVDDPRVW